MEQEKLNLKELTRQLQQATATTTQEFYRLNSKVRKLTKLITTSVNLDTWKQGREITKNVVVSGTDISEYRLVDEVRVLLRRIIAKCMDPLKDGKLIPDLSYDSFYIAESLEVWIPDCRYKSLVDNQWDLVSYINNVSDMITKLVLLGDERSNCMPPDVEHLINYLKTTPPHKFNPDVVTTHTSLWAYSTLEGRASYLNSYMWYEYDKNAACENQPGELAKLLAKFQGQMQSPYSHMQDKNDKFWKRARKNPRVADAHDRICDSTDSGLANSDLGFLVFIGYLISNELDPRWFPEALKDSLVDDCLYALFPLYMSQIVKILVEEDLLPASWMD